MKNNPWARPVVSLFIFLILNVIALFLCRNLKVGESRSQRYLVYTVSFEYYGMDAGELERLITIPLEEKIVLQGGIHQLRSVSEYGKVNCTIYFDKSAGHKKAYLALRDIGDTLYNSLPGGVQKPRIYASSSENRAFLSAAISAPGNLNTLRKYADNEIKKALQGIDGVAEVIVSGGSQEEIRVEFDPGRISALGIDPAAIGGIIRDANVVMPGTILYKDEKNDSLKMDTKIKNLEEIKRLPVKAGEKISSLSYFADIDFRTRDGDEIVRINGAECIGIQVKAASHANIIKASKACRDIIANSGLGKDAYQILYDQGAETAGLINSVLFSVLQSFIVIILIIPFFFRSRKILCMLILLIPVNCIWTLAILDTLGIGTDQNILSGLSISLGLIVDAPLLIAGLREESAGKKSFVRGTQKIIPPIIASALTTVLVLIPLYFLDSIVPGIKSIAVCIACMLINSLLISCIFFPCFILKADNNSLLPRPILKKNRKWYTRNAYWLAGFSERHPRLMVMVYALLAILSFLCFFLLGKNLSFDRGGAYVYAAAEYDPERHELSIDNELAAFGREIQAAPAVTFVRMESRKGLAEFEIGFDPRKSSRRELAERVSNASYLIPGGFLYVPDAAPERTRQIHEIEIAVSGDDSGLCREYAREAAAVLAENPELINCVLNFKNPETVVEFIPDREILIKNGLTANRTAGTLRWYIFGPVIDKWLSGKSETDIRVAGAGPGHLNREQLSNLYIRGPENSVRIESLGLIQTAKDSGKIYRQDGRRTAFLTAHIGGSSTEAAVRRVKKSLEHIDLERGYGFSLSRDLEILGQQYRILFTAFIFSIVLILLLLTMLTENPLNALLITSIIPVSNSLPLICFLIIGKPLEMGHIVGMIITGGVSVNNAIYLCESGKSRIIFRVREKIQSILLTSITSIASALPLAISGKGFTAALAETMLLGILGSLAASIILFPSLIKVFRTK